MTYDIKSVQKIVPHGTTQSYKSDDGGYTSVVNTLVNLGFNSFAAYMIITLYRQCAPVYDAVTRITDAAKTIQPFVYDVKNNEYSDNHAILDLLKKPNYRQTRDEFVEEAMQYYLVTGNAYFIVTCKNPNSPAYEIFNASPEYMSITGSAPDDRPETYQYSPVSRNAIFKPREIKRQLRYFTEDGTQELIHWKKVDILKSRALYYGMSPLTPLWIEIEQYLKASNHNLSMLIRGVAASGIFSSQGRLSPDQRASIREQLDRLHAGANNAGRPMLVDEGMEFTQTTISNRDMDYEKMQDRVRKQIYCTEKIPLPLIVAETMTYSNKEVSDLELFDHAVLPNTTSFLNIMHRYLMQRYVSNPDDYELRYEESKIAALAVRRFETLKRQRELGIYSVNELRTEAKADPAIGGSSVYPSAGGTIPIAKVEDGTEDMEPLAEDFDNTVEPQGDEKMNTYLYALGQMRNADGTPTYSKAELKKFYESTQI